MVKKKIAVVTGTRADFGLLRPVLRGLQESLDVELLLFVTGTHLSPEFGMTINEIETDGFPIKEKIEILLDSDSSVGVGKSMGLAMMGFAEAFARYSPDITVLLGDRYETFCAAAAATISRVPIAHIHGGELTLGAIDDAFRHSITKMSQLHFPATEEYRQRIVQMGERPENVYNVGSLGVEQTLCIIQQTRENLEADLKITLKELNFLVTFHPATLSTETIEKQIEALFAALDHFPEAFIIFTKANADMAGREINARLEEYAIARPGRAAVFASLGQVRYLSLLRLCDAVIGNSSSGIIEAPTIGTPTVNIGERQEGRVKAESVFDCRSDAEDIIRNIRSALEFKHRNNPWVVVNPYFKEHTSGKIVEKLLDRLPKLSVKKNFYSLQ